MLKIEDAENDDSDIILHYNKTINENASFYYEKAKKLRHKIDGIKEAIKELNKKLEQRKNFLEKQRPIIKVLTKKEWFERFYYAYSSKMHLIIAGRNQEQNELVVSKYAEKDEWFFHADIKGGAATILKSKEADDKELIEAAQIAACYSKAWKMNYKYINVFSAKVEQLTKRAGKQMLPKGEFNIEGVRRYYKNVPLSIKIGLLNGKIIIAPSLSELELDKCFLIKPGYKKRNEITAMLSKVYGIHQDNVSLLLPSGGFSLSKCSK